MADWKQAGVVGCGLMGAGIVEVCARAGMSVVVREADEKFLSKGLDRVKKSLWTAAEKSKITPDERDAAWSKVRGTTDLAEMKDCDIVIEAITEDTRAKRELFAALDKVVKKDALFASNTSSISITAIASATERAEQFVGLHFFNPVPVMKLVEIVRGFRTSDETMSLARALAEKIGKLTIIAKDTPGFIVNLLLVPYIIGAVRALEAGLASRDDIDNGMKLGCGHPMGPLQLLDYVGLDTTLFIADIMFAELKTHEHAAPPLLRRMVAAGYMGRKSGKGFYDWSSGQPR